MGGGNWNATTYTSKTAPKIATGTNFGYSAATKASGKYQAHETLDPKKINAQGLNIRESRDSTEHPNSVPIVVGFDETGSMGTIPQTVQEKLPNLFGLLTRKQYVEDPQICIAAYGDAYTDYVPLQISQFESDNRTDNNLESLFLEGNGGGNGGETQTLLWYYLAYHTATDAWEKRNKKGYLFLIGDERPLDLKPEQIKDFVGDGEPFGPLDQESLAKALQEKWEVIILLVDNQTCKWQGSRQVYEKLFGKNNVVTIEDANTITETIGSALGFLEGTLDNLDDAEEDLRAVGTSELVIAHTTKAVAGLSKLSKGSVAKVETELDDTEEDNVLRF